MTEYSYLTRLISDRAAIQRLDDARGDFEAQIRLLRYVEAEGQTERAALQVDLAAARKALEELEQTLIAAREAEVRAREAEVRAREAEVRAREAEVRAREAEALEREAVEELERALAAARRETVMARETEVQQRAAAERLEQDLATARHDADVVRETLQGVYRSTSWRMTGPLRRLVSLVRREMPEAPIVSDLAYDAATRMISEKYLGDVSEEGPRPLHALLGSGEMVARRLAEVAPGAAVPLSLLPACYTVVTPYFSHYTQFGCCAESVMAMLEADFAHRNAPRVQWIVVNDDPSCPDDRLRALVPAALLPHTTILSNVRNEGIVAAQNRGVRAAANAWVLMLDCDDTIESNALTVLDSYISQFPSCRYFSALMTDIDEDGRVLRQRRRDAPANEMFSAGMVVGHLVAFRRDLFDELEGFDPRFSGVQDYDFALRAAAREPLRQIPEHLYRYRWHDASQSVSRAKRQGRLTEAVRSSFLRGFLHSDASRSQAAAPLPAEPRGLCIIRTQGTRIELLAGAVASVWQQAISITPCVVVHGDDATLGMVERQLMRALGPANGPEPIFLAAPDLTRRRGYPCNVGLEFLYAHADRFDLLCFLDDDDYLLPNFATRLVEALRQRGADMAYGLTNALPVSGEPELQHQLLPSVALFHGNFMPIHSYLVRTAALLAVKARFDETLNYLEDWDFLIQIMGGGARAVPLFDTVAEYRLIGDGNILQRRDPEHFEHCLSVVRQRGAEAARRLPLDRFWFDVLDFPTDRRTPLIAAEQAVLLAAKALFTGEAA